MHKNIINSNNRSNHHLKHLVRGGLLFLLAITFGLVFIAISRKQDKKENKKLTLGDKKSTNSAALATIVKNINKNPTTRFEDVNPISPITDAIAVSNNTMANSEITKLPDGNLFTTWRFGSDANLYGKKFTPVGDVISEQIQIPLEASNYIPYYDTLPLPNENIFSIYIKDFAPSTSYVAGQITDQDLQPTAPSFQISTNTAYSLPVYLEIFPTGDVVAGWSHYNIRAQYLTIDGTAIGPETNIGNIPNSIGPHVTIQSTNKHTFFWNTYYQSPFALYMQKMHADRTTDGSTIKIADIQANQGGTDIYTAAAIQPDDTTVLAWNTKESVDNKYHLYAKRIPSDGSLSNPNIEVSDYSYSSWNSPISIAMLSNGNFAISWSTSTFHQVCARYFSADGIPLSSELNVYQFSNTFSITSISSVGLPNGILAINWGLTTWGNPPNLWLRLYATQALSPIIQKYSLTVNGRGTKTIVTENDIFVFNPSGSSASVKITPNDCEHGAFVNCATDHPLDNFLQGQFSNGEVCHQQDGTNYPPTCTITAENDVGLTDGPKDITFDFINPNDPITINQQAPNIQGTVDETTTTDVTNVFSSDDSLRWWIERADGQALNAWMKLLEYISTGKKEIKSMPGAGTQTATFYLMTQKTNRITDANLTAKSSFQLIMDSSDIADGTPLWKILTPVFSTAFGLSGSSGICLLSLICTFLATNTAFIARHKYSARSARNSARKQDYLAFNVFKNIGEPNDCADFSSDEGLLFIDMIRSILKTAQLKEPTQTEARKIKSLAHNIAAAIKESFNMHHYHPTLRNIVGSQASIMSCGFFHPGSTGDFLKTHENEIADKLNALTDETLSAELRETRTDSISPTVDARASLLANDSLADIPDERRQKAVPPFFTQNPNDPNTLQQTEQNTNPTNYFRLPEESEKDLEILNLSAPQ